MKAKYYTDKQKMKLIKLYYHIQDILEGKPLAGLRFYTAEERRKRKTDYMLHKPWYCDICGNGKNYTLAGKSCHLRTKKHYKNAYTYDTGYIYDEKENSN